MKPYIFQKATRPKSLTPLQNFVEKETINIYKYLNAMVIACVIIGILFLILIFPMLGPLRTEASRTLAKENLWQE